MTKLINQPNCKSFFTKLLSVGLLALPSPSAAAELRTSTLTAWNQYLQTAEKQMEGKRGTGSGFSLLTDVRRRREVSQGKIIAEPVNDSGMQSIPGGLIHDWIGAAFIPNTTIDHLQDVVTDYNRYKDIYRPNVVASRFLEHRQLGQTQGLDRLSLRIVNKMSIMTAAIDAEYQVKNIQLDRDHAYSIAVSTNIRQIRNYGKTNQIELPPGQGDGFIWQLCSISKYEEGDGGVYVELEAIALSRDIPNSLRWLIKPLAAKLSRNSMLISLSQTKIAVTAKPEMAYRRVPSTTASLRSER